MANANRKSAFLDLVRRAKQDGRKTSTVHGARSRWWCRANCLTGSTSSAESLVAFMQRSPLHDGDDIVFDRDPEDLPVRLCCELSD